MRSLRSMREARMLSSVPSPGILLVDDTIENLRLLSSILTTNGFEVRPVTSGADALQAIAHAIPELILLDVMMPDMDGFELCTKLKAEPAWRDIPVIFLTAMTEVDQKVRGFAVGGNDYITKPFQLEEVLSRVRNQLDVQRSRRELASNLQRLQQLERLRDDLVHMIVHDMRSPISGLYLTLDMIQAAAQGDARVQLAEAMRLTASLHEMTNCLLDVSRLEEGKMPLQPQPCDLSKLAARACDEARAYAPKRVIKCLRTAPVNVSCDASLISRVLANLISNGIKHTEDNNTILVGVAATEQGARVIVQDDGPGIPAELRGRLFEKFAAVGRREPLRYHSAGLGLAFCKLAVEAHGGKIGVESAANSGSTFWFELPA
jgi:signal transduction histidine kinase